MDRVTADVISDIPMSIYFDPNSKQFALNFNELTFWSSNFGYLLLDNIPLKQKMRALDVGCATGFPLLELADRLGNDSSLVGIDPWVAAVEYLKEKIDFRKTPNVTVTLGDTQKTLFENNHFDLIVSNLGLNNFENKDLVIRECYRILASDGRLAIATNYKGHMWEFYQAYRESLKELHLESHLEKIDKDDNRRLTITEIQSLFTTEGFVPSKTIEKKFFMRYVSGTAFLQSSFIERCFMSTWKSLLPELERNRVFSQIENKLNAIALKAGELKISIPMAYLEFTK